MNNLTTSLMVGIGIDSNSGLGSYGGFTYVKPPRCIKFTRRPYKIGKAKPHLKKKRKAQRLARRRNRNA